MPVPVQLYFSPARVVMKYLISTGTVVAKPPNTPVGQLPSWVAYAHKLQAEGTPDNAVAVVNTAPVPGPRDMHDGESYKHDGIQVLVRSKDQETGYLKCVMIAKWLTENLKNSDVTLAGGGVSVVYRLHAFTLTAHPTYIGEEEQSLRHFHTLNGTLAFTQTSVTPTP